MTGHPGGEEESELERNGWQGITDLPMVKDSQMATQSASARLRGT